MSIYHIISKQEWEIIKKEDFYRPVNFEEDGFIHLYYKGSIEDVANSVYSDYTELIILEVLIDKLENKQQLIIEDLLDDGIEYPHLYASLNLSAVKNTFELTQINGKFKMNF